MSARWPTGEEVDDVLLKEAAYLTEISHDFRVRIKKMVELRAKVRQARNTQVHFCFSIAQKGQTVDKLDYGVIYVAKEYPKWQQTILIKLKEQ